MAKRHLHRGEHLTEGQHRVPYHRRRVRTIEFLLDTLSHVSQDNCATRARYQDALV